MIKPPPNLQCSLLEDVKKIIHYFKNNKTGKRKERIKYDLLFLCKLYLTDSQIIDERKFLFLKIFLL